MQSFLIESFEGVSGIGEIVRHHHYAFPTSLTVEYYITYCDDWLKTLSEAPGSAAHHGIATQVLDTALPNWVLSPQPNTRWSISALAQWLS